MVKTVLFPVSYSAYGTMPGRTNRLSYTLAEMTEISVLDVDPELAPIAVSWKVPDRFGFNGGQAMWARDETSGQHTVYFEGRHWVRMLDWTKGDPSPPLRTDDFLAGATAGEFSWLLGFPQPTRSKRRFTVVDGDPKSQLPDIDTSQRHNAKLIARGLEFISVGGVLHQRCDQPVFRLIIEHLGTEDNKLIATAPVVDAFESRGPRNYFLARNEIIPLFMENELSAHCPLMDRIIAVPFEGPTIHVPEAISIADNLRAAADFYVQTFLLQSQDVGFHRALHDRKFPETFLQMRDVEAKLEYLAEQVGAWGNAAEKLGLSTDALYRAIEYLDNVPISVDLGSQSVARSRLSP
ncbi:hypothetical protein HFO56_01790 [Rhizobium laguerreae]|uniref:hypothetical protein n=1 Tax=Rhizobium laguerreae TaxID=1076926 RepID=UPI001C927CA9|nr:hypothetical protein [Rhizobium laguerreae]MBY3151138.1 hypothetical protein [Rhizobium laguerreae]